MNNRSWSRGKGESTSGGHVDHLLSAYIQKDLDPATRAEVLKHLQSCADCRADYIELVATRRLLRSMPTVPPPRAFTITPEMAVKPSPATSRQSTIWSRLFAPRNAPRFAFG